MNFGQQPSAGFGDEHAYYEAKQDKAAALSNQALGRRKPGRPADSDTGLAPFTDILAEQFAQALGVDDQVLRTPKLFFNEFPEWPTRSAARIVNSAFMHSLAARLPFPRDRTGQLLNQGQLGLLAGAIVFDGCIHGSATHPESRRNPIIRAKVSIAQSDHGDLADLQRVAAPLHSSINRGAPNDRDDVIRAPWRLDFDGAWAVAVVAITYPWLLSRKRQALVLTRLFCEGLFFAHPRCAGWPQNVWDHRENLVEHLSALKGRLNRSPRKKRV